MRKYYADTKASKAFDVINTVILVVFFIIVIYPLWDQFIISINDGTKTALGDIGLWPKYISMDAYRKIIEESKIFKGALVSILRVVVGTVTCVFCTGLLAYITTIRRFKGRTIVRRLFIFTMYFGGGLIPVYLLMVQLRLLNSFAVYILPGLFSAYYMLLIASYIQNLPESLFEAARIDGCSELRIYTKIVIPVCVPVFAAVAVYVAVGHWNSWFDVFLYNPEGKWDTLQVYLRRVLLEAEAFNAITDQSLAANKFKGLSSQSLKAATTVIVTFPILVTYPFFQKYFISGITIGAVKE